jgi:hypothetical protein
MCLQGRGGLRPFDSHDLLATGSCLESRTGNKKIACPKVKKGAKTREIPEILGKVVPVLLHPTADPSTRCTSSNNSL